MDPREREAAPDIKFVFGEVSVNECTCPQSTATDSVLEIKAFKMLVEDRLCPADILFKKMFSRAF